MQSNWLVKSGKLELDWLDPDLEHSKTVNYVPCWEAEHNITFASKLYRQLLNNSSNVGSREWKTYSKKLNRCDIGGYIFNRTFDEYFLRSRSYVIEILAFSDHRECGRSLLRWGVRQGMLKEVDWGQTVEVFLSNFVELASGSHEMVLIKTMSCDRVIFCFD